MAESGSPMVNAAAAAPEPSGPEAQDTSWPRYRRSRRRRATEQASNSDPEVPVETPEHQLDSLA